MIALKNACRSVQEKHPEEYIHVVNEFKMCYAFLLLQKNEKVGPATFFATCTTVDKETGKISEDVPLFADEFQGDYKQYSKEDIEKLLNSSS